MDTALELEDTFGSLGAAAGVFLLVMALAAVVAMPWATNNSIPTSVVQLLGIVGTFAIGAGLVWLARQ